VDLATVVVDPPDADESPVHTPTAGDVVGRYIVESCIGKGGMGVVLRARDPKLGREVALKLLRARSGPDRSEGPTRLLREAQALARLSHPNVIDVFDVGTFDGQVFIAMEYVRGQTLGAWMEEAHDIDAILDVFAAAGRGLAAAHRSGLVHRDFKPHNVLLGDDGRVRVLDFGLAAPTGHRSRGATTVGGANDALDVRVTATGLIMGTPAYMAPECHRGDLVDARSDQFSFCVALFEALYGKRPFRGSNARTLAAQAAGGEIETPPDVVVPVRLRSAVRRGLAPRPADRWPSMDALLDALRPRRSAAWGWALGGIVAAAAVGFALLPDREDACDEAARVITQAYGQQQRTAIATAFMASGVAYADETLTRVSTHLETYAQQLADARRAACRAARGDDRPAASAGGNIDERAACLHRRFEDLEGLVELLSRADATTIRHATSTASSLVPVSDCERELDSALAPPAQIAEEVAKARAELGRARTLMGLGHYDEGLEITVTVVDQAEALQFEPLRAEALLRRGLLLDEDGQYELAAVALEEATMVAQSVGHDEVVAPAATQLIYLLGTQLNRHDEALDWVRHATAAVERLGETPELRSHLLSSQGNLAMAMGHPEQARGHFEEALRIREASAGPQHPGTLTVRSSLGMAYYELGDNRRALELLHETLDLRIAALGPRHPEVASALGNLGVLHQVVGEYEESVRLTQRGLDIIEASLGREHPNYPRLLTNLANTESLRDNLEEAAIGHEKARKLFETSMGPRSVQVAKSWNNLGVIAQRQGDTERAHDCYRRALQIAEERVGPDHPEVVSAVTNLAMLAANAGRAEEALEGFARATRILEASVGDEHPALAGPIAGRGNAHLDLGHVEQALADLRRAVALQEKADESPGALGEVRFQLGRAQWQAGQHDDAIASIRAARGEVGGRADDGTKLVADIAAWLEEHDAAR
jgi:tetratricopeptide (TPR) repeat protein/tRNA A-37 threonylcarbamoyl transferase component Bud32